MELTHQTYLEYKKNGSSKFYQVSVYRYSIRPALYSVERRWGKIGTTGSSVSESFGYTDAYIKAGEYVGAKVKKGYEVVTITNHTEPLPETESVSKTRKKLVKAWADEDWDVL
jgi:predicted DNA-binding WGR domain protein